MNVSNHLLAGAVIAVTIKQPAAALPLALLSHFVLDALPHYGHEGAGFDEWRKHKTAYFLVGVDAVIGLLFLTVLMTQSLWLALVAALLAASPDVVWVYRYLRYERFQKVPPYSPLTKFHVDIQWGERPWGLYVEILAFALFVWALSSLT